MEATLSLLIFEFSALLWSLQIDCSSLYSWQPITTKITAILATSLEDGLTIGQFLVQPAVSQPIHRDQVGALVSQYCCLHIIYLRKVGQCIREIVVSCLTFIHATVVQ